MGVTHGHVMIRQYTPADLEACRGLWVQLTDWHRHIYNSPGIGGPDPEKQFDALLERVGPQRIWVADASNRIVGMCGLIPGQTDAELEPIIVDSSHRGAGIGRRLALTAIDAARAQGFRQVFTRPVARNDPAIHFFHQLGFDVLGQIEVVLDFASIDRQIWRPGPRIAGKDFRL